MFPTRHSRDTEAFVARFSIGPAPTARTPDGLFQWLEEAEPVWRAAYSFDKPGEALSNSTDWDPPDVRRGPIVTVMAFINRARRFRQVGDYEAAGDSIERARAAVTLESNLHIRAHVEASCHLQQGWLDYRRPGAPEGPGPGPEPASLLRRHRKLYDEALEDLWLASQNFFVEVDLYNLLSVYHNLSCLLSERADGEQDLDRRYLEMRREAAETPGCLPGSHPGFRRKPHDPIR